MNGFFTFLSLLAILVTMYLIVRLGMQDKKNKDEREERLRMAEIKAGYPAGTYSSAKTKRKSRKKERKYLERENEILSAKMEELRKRINNLEVILRERR